MPQEKANGFSSVTVINEARCLTDLAFSLADPELNLYLQELASGRREKGLALFGDIGGLTGDFNLVDIRFENNHTIQRFYTGQYTEKNDWIHAADTCCVGTSIYVQCDRFDDCRSVRNSL